MRRQKNLFTGKTQGTARGQRGREFEAELDAIHELYAVRGLVMMFHQQQEWKNISVNEYHATLQKNPAVVARTGNGVCMKKLYSNVDFTGGNGRQSYAFDAKEIQENTFPLTKVHEHQVRRLNHAVNCGMTAGLMIKFTEHDRLFFVDARTLEVKYLNWKRQSGVAKKGTASFSIPELEQAGVEVFRDKMNMLWDWYSVLF